MPTQTQYIFSEIFLDISGCLRTKWGNGEKWAVSWFKKWGRTKEIIKVGKIGDKDRILTVQEK